MKPAPAIPAAVSHPLEDLVPTLHGEAARIRELRDALARQRGHVAAHDAAALQQGADEIARLLMAVDEVRRQRTETVAALAQDPGTSLSGLAARLGRRETPAFQRARAELEQAAVEAQREAALNHQVLRRAVESGEAFLQALFASVGDAGATYGPDSRGDAGTHGLFLNRTA